MAGRQKIKRLVNNTIEKSSLFTQTEQNMERNGLDSRDVVEHKNTHSGHFFVYVDTFFWQTRSTCVLSFEKYSKIFIIRLKTFRGH